MAGEILWSDFLAGSLIGFREAVEAALIIGVLMTWLVRSDRGLLSRWIWFGVGAGIAASLVVASLFGLNLTNLIFVYLTRLTAAIIRCQPIPWTVQLLGPIYHEPAQRHLNLGAE